MPFLVLFGDNSRVILDAINENHFMGAFALKYIYIGQLTVAVGKRDVSSSLSDERQRCEIIQDWLLFKTNTLVLILPGLPCCCFALVTRDANLHHHS